MSSIAVNTGQLFRYGAALLFEDELFTVPAGNAVYFDNKINGVFGGLLDALADVWGAVAVGTVALLP